MELHVQHNACNLLSTAVKALLAYSAVKIKRPFTANALHVGLPHRDNHAVHPIGSARQREAEGILNEEGKPWLVTPPRGLAAK